MERLYVAETKAARDMAPMLIDRKKNCCQFCPAALAYLVRAEGCQNSEEQHAKRHADSTTDVWLWALPVVCGICLLAKVDNSLDQQRRHEGGNVTADFEQAWRELDLDNTHLQTRSQETPRSTPK